MLYEEKLLFYSKYSSTIEFCCEALISLLYPFYWQHVYIPIVPLATLDYIDMPLPSMLGAYKDAINGSVCKKVLSQRIVINLDAGTIEADEEKNKECLPPSIEKYFIDAFNRMLYMTDDGGNMMLNKKYNIK